MSLFASQFSWGTPYTPAELRPGVLQVGATLPRGPRDKNPTEDPTKQKNPSEQNPGQGISSGKSAGLGAGSRAGALAGAGASAGAAGSRGLASQSAQVPYAPGVEPANDKFFSLTHVTAPTHGTNPGTPGTGVSPGRSGLQPGGAGQSSPGGNGFGHWVAHTFDSARHGVASAADATGTFMSSPTVHSIMNFGNPFPAGSPGNPNFDPEHQVFPNQAQLRQERAQQAQQSTVPGVQPDLWNVPEPTHGVGSSQASSAIDHGPLVRVPQQVNANQFGKVGGPNDGAGSAASDTGSGIAGEVENFLKLIAEGAEAA